MSRASCLAINMSVSQCSAGHVVPKILDGRRVLKFVAHPFHLVGLDEKGNSETLTAMQKELPGLAEKLEDFDRQIAAFAKKDPTCHRLMTIPGIGVLTATILIAMVGDPFRFKNGRHFAAYLGLVPQQHSSGGKNVLLGISKQGDTYLRTLLIHGGRAMVRSVQRLASGGQELRGRNAWIADLLLRRGYNRTAVAVANKNARVIWVLLTKNAAVCGPTGRKARKAA